MSIRSFLHRHAIAAGLTLLLGAAGPVAVAAEPAAAAPEPQPSRLERYLDAQAGKVVPPPSKSTTRALTSTPTREHNSQVRTNLSEISPRKDALRDLEDQFNDSFRGWNPNSLDGIAAPRFRNNPTVPNPKLKEFLDKRRNWAYSTPEEILNAPDPDKIANPDSKFKTGRQARNAEDFINDETKKRFIGSSMDGAAALDDPSQNKDSLSGNKNPKESDTPEGLRSTEDGLRKLLGNSESTAEFSSTPGRGNFSDFFGLGERVTPKEQEDAHKAYMKEYQEILDIRGPNAGGLAGQSLNSLAPADSSSRLSGFKPMDTPSTTHRGPDAQFGLANPGFNTSGLSDPNARSMAPWSPAHAAPPPAYTPPKPVTSALPTFTAPRRNF